MALSIMPYALSFYNGKAFILNSIINEYGGVIMAKAVDDKLWAVLSYLLPLWWVPLWVIKPRNDFSVYHARQAFGLFIAGIIMYAIASFSMVILIGFVLLPLVILFLTIISIVGIVYAATGKKQPLPLLGKYFEDWFGNL